MSAAFTRAIASLFRLAAAARQDAALLLGQGRCASAARVAAEAAGWVVQGVAVSEAGWPSDAGLDAVPGVNPLRDNLAALLRACPMPPLVRPNGLQGAEPDAKQVQRSLDQLESALAAAARLFAVDLAGEGPAGRDIPLRQEPDPEPESSKVVPLAGRRIVVRPAAAQSAPTSRPVPPSVPIAPPVRAGGPSSTFWALMDRWGVDDQTALALLGHEGGLGKKGTRPRFKLEGAEAERFAFLREIDSSLRSLSLDARAWLRAPVAVAPFGGKAPLAFLAAGGGGRDVNRFILQQGLRLSMGSVGSRTPPPSASPPPPPEEGGG